MKNSFHFYDRVALLFSKGIKMTQLAFGFLSWPLGQDSLTNLSVLVVVFTHSFILSLQTFIVCQCFSI